MTITDKKIIETGLDSLNEKLESMAKNIVEESLAHLQNSSPIIERTMKTKVTNKMDEIIEKGLEALNDPSNTCYKVCYETMSNEDYHSLKSYLSRSSIMDFDKSPYTYWAKHLNPNRPKKDVTPAMEFGTAFHTLILEPHLFCDNYAIKPPKLLLKNVGRDIYDDFKRKELELESTKKTVITYEEYLTLIAMEKKLHSNDKVMQMIHEARIENSFFWKDEDTGLLLKARPDILRDNMIVDLKTCSDASPHAFQREMVQYGYHVQGAMIRDAVEACEGRRINTVINVCVETKYPHNIGIYIIDEHAIDEGQAKYKSILVDIKHAIDNNEYRDYGVQTIGLPKWAL